MSQSNEQYTFEPIVIMQDEIEYYRGLKNYILNNFILNFRDHIEVIDNQLYYLKHQFFVINRKNLIETLDWTKSTKFNNRISIERQNFCSRRSLKKERFKLLKIFYQKEDTTELQK